MADPDSPASDGARNGPGEIIVKLSIATNLERSTFVHDERRTPRILVSAIMDLFTSIEAPFS